MEIYEEIKKIFENNPKFIGTIGVLREQLSRNMGRNIHWMTVKTYADMLLENGFLKTLEINHKNKTSKLYSLSDHTFEYSSPESNINRKEERRPLTPKKEENCE